MRRHFLALATLLLLAAGAHAQGNDMEPIYGSITHSSANSKQPRFQWRRFSEPDPDRDTSWALMMTFRSHELLNPNATKAEKDQWQKETRERMEQGAKEYAEMLLKADLGKLKPGFEFRS